MSCERHSSLCAYDGTEPDRCPRCHARWAVITGPWGETRESHETDHDRADAIQAQSNARRAASRVQERAEWGAHATNSPGRVSVDPLTIPSPQNRAPGISA